MSEEDFIITTYCLVEKLYQESYGTIRLRDRGPAPSLTDIEVLTILIVGEYLGFESDKRIWDYFKRHWQSWFPRLGCRTSFTRQSANLLQVMDQLQQILSEKLCGHTDLFLFDGLPIPICHIKRYKRSNPFRGVGAVGYCAAKNEKYFGFKGHLLISYQGVTKGFSIASANIDERDILPEVAEGLRGDVIADKGLIRPHLIQTLANQGLILHTPLRKNMDTRPHSFLSQIMNIRHKVETVIEQRVERFKIQAIKARDSWHLRVKIGRKILAHTVCFMINLSVNSQTPLQIEKFFELKLAHCVIYRFLS